MGKSLTPEERARLPGLFLQVHSNSADCFDGRGAGGITRQHDVEIREIALAKTLIEVRNLLGSCASSLKLPVASMVTYLNQSVAPRGWNGSAGYGLVRRGWDAPWPRNMIRLTKVNGV